MDIYGSVAEATTASCGSQTCVRRARQSSVGCASPR